ncbi:MAG: hypothetical protein GXX96_09005 [Planctomycetaceae bacterium]|jgi:hypothetical protein|nr:hypothetical protein [Planctomycetaceae bacterium]
MMKVYAESLVPPKVPFIHLGYVAIKGAVSGAIDSALGIGGLLLGGAILAAAIVAHSRTPGGNSGAGKAAMVVGAIFLAFAVAYGGIVISFNTNVNQIEATMDRMQGIAEKMQEQIAAGESVPTSMEAIQSRLGLSDSDMLDSWGHPLTMRQEADDDVSLTLLVSAGADGRMETSDDFDFPINP